MKLRDTEPERGCSVIARAGLPLPGEGGLGKAPSLLSRVRRARVLSRVVLFPEWNRAVGDGHPGLEPHQRKTFHRTTTQRLDPCSLHWVCFAFLEKGLWP